MALSFDTYTGTGSQVDFTVSFGYISQTHVDVYLDGVLKTVSTDYTWFNATTIRFGVAPGSGVVVRIERATPNTARLVDFQDAGNLTEADLDTSADQNFYLVQETVDGFDEEALKLATDNKWDGESKVIKLVADPTSAQDVATKNYTDGLWTTNLATIAAAVAATAADVVTTNADVVLTNADVVSTNADAAATAADAAATAADLVQTNLDTIATAADAVSTAADAAATAADLVQTNLDQISCDADATAAAASAAAASTSETNAATSETNCAAHETAVTNLYDSFDDRYLGPKASAPTLDNDGNALLTGALYWNTADDTLYVYDGSAWQASSVSPADHYTKVAADAKFPNPNLLYNPDFELWQRGTSSVAHTSGDYLADRWFTAHSGAMVYTLGKTSTSTDLPFRFYHRLDVTTADASMAAGDFGHFSQKLEGLDINHLNWGTATEAKDLTLRFWHRHTKTGTHSVAIRNSAGTRCYIREYTQSVTNDWEEAEVTFPAETSGTWATDTTTGLVLSFAIACGTTYSAAADTWHTSGNYFASTNQVNNFDNVNNVFDIAHVKLEVGDSATDWEPRPYGVDRAMCKRYFQLLLNGHDAIGAGNMQSATQAYVLVPLPVQMRATPSITGLTVSDLRVRDGANITPSAVAVQNSTQNGVVLDITVSGGTQYAACSVRDAGTADLIFDAEL